MWYSFAEDLQNRNVETPTVMAKLSYYKNKTSIMCDVYRRLIVHSLEGDVGQPTWTLKLSSVPEGEILLSHSFWMESNHFLKMHLVSSLPSARYALPRQTSTGNCLSEKISPTPVVSSHCVAGTMLGWFLVYKSALLFTAAIPKLWQVDVIAVILQQYIEDEFLM